MTTVAELPARRVPRDTFPIRLAIVRAEMGWNYDQAEAATGINSESWRMWEKGKRRCADIEGVSHTISRATGFSFEWLMIGGALASPAPTTPTGGGAIPRDVEVVRRQGLEPRTRWLRTRVGALAPSGGLTILPGNRAA